MTKHPQLPAGYISTIHDPATPVKLSHIDIATWY